MFTATPWMIYPQIMHKPALPWVFRRPTQEDGLSIHELIAQCAPLESEFSLLQLSAVQSFSNNMFDG